MGEAELGSYDSFSGDTLVLSVNSDDRCDAEPWDAWYGPKGFIFRPLITTWDYEIECQRENF